jgi:hypothetical protein
MWLHVWRCGGTSFDTTFPCFGETNMCHDQEIYNIAVVTHDNTVAATLLPLPSTRFRRLLQPDSHPALIASTPSIEAGRRIDADHLL